MADVRHMNNSNNEENNDNNSNKKKEVIDSNKGDKNDENNNNNKKSVVTRGSLYVFGAIFLTYAVGVGVNLALAWLTGYKKGSASLILGDKGLEMKFDFTGGGFGGSDANGGGGNAAA